jgi:transcription antitermination factor NusA-like protein
VDVGDFVVILTQKEDIGKIIGPGGQNLRKIEKSIGKLTKVMSARSAEEMISTLIFPANIISTSKLYRSDGTVMRKITINKNDVDKLKIDIHSIKKIVSNLVHADVEIILG